MNAVTTYHNSAQVATGLFGLCFFAAGYFISCSEVKGGATVALFSHGLTGFCIMNSLPAMHILHSPLMSDVSGSIGVWIIAALATLILSLFFGLLNSLIPEFRENPIKKSLAFAFAAISTIIIQVLAIYLGF
jgi:hypothetical protein